MRRWWTGRRGRMLLLGALSAVAMAIGVTNGLVSEWTRPVKAMPECPAGRPMVIDPGHGGIDGGTNVPGLLEKDLVLDVALRLKQRLERMSIPVVLTRETDTDLGGPYDSGRLRRDLTYRLRVANHCRAAFMLSLHVNHASHGQEQGMLVFYQPSRLGRDAAYLFDDILRRWPLHERREEPVPRGDFAVLKTRAPALLIELGFLSNPADRERLADPNYRDRIAAALASGCGAIYHQWVK